MIADHDDTQNSLPAFLLSTAEPEEAEAVRAHLEGCSTCRDLVKRLQSAIGALPLAVDSVTPPSRLRERILAAAAASPPSTWRPAPARVLRLPRPRAWLRRAPGLRPSLAAAALVAFALGSGLGLGLGRALPPASQPPAAVAQYSLTGSGAMAGAQGRVFELRREGLTLVEFSGLAQPDQGKIYELWLISKAGQAEPATVFAPDSQGSHVVVLARNLSGLKALAVTQEAGPGGTLSPTQQPQLIGSVG